VADLFAKRQAKGEGDSHWMPVSDLMSGLMIVFLFIAVALMRNAFEERDKIKEVAVAYQENQVAIYEALNDEFAKDLSRWDATIDESTLTFTFNSPEVLFKIGEIELSDQYRQLLSDFFPRYMQVLDGFKGSINEVRIEGHTSSVWNRFTSDTDAYFKNMELSQGRTRAVLEYVYELRSISQYRQWVKARVAAVGFSSAQPILAADGGEDGERSRRVTFRVITNADIQMKQILEMQ